MSVLSGEGDFSYQILERRSQQQVQKEVEKQVIETWASRKHQNMQSGRSTTEPHPLRLFKAI